MHGKEQLFNMKKEGRLRAGDELVGIDGITVKGKSHKQVLDLMTNAARNGQVLLSVRRKVIYRGERCRLTGLRHKTSAPVLFHSIPSSCFSFTQPQNCYISYD
uniref:PDZ domain-containing protein n=1 Tax=Sinocyclocheilus anshuiensis TaxID=1608454 RepID=A0A671PL28_9TELE